MFGEVEPVETVLWPGTVTGVTVEGEVAAVFACPEEAEEVVFPGDTGRPPDMRSCRSSRSASRCCSWSSSFCLLSSSRSLSSLSRCASSVST